MLVFIAVVVTILVASLIFILVWPSFGKRPSSEMAKTFSEKTDLYFNNKFNNAEDFKLIVDVKDKLKKEETEEINKRPNKTIKVNKLTELEDADISDMKITWFGHSTSLIQIHGMNILIDPILSEYASPVGFAGPKRFSEVPMTAEDLPEIDLVLISHDHYDHMDYNTLKEIDSKVKAYCVPLGVDSHLDRWGIEESKINTLSWWEDVNINGLIISLTPGQHFSGRLPWNMNSTLWGGYVLKDEYNSLYYTGDTGYGEFFKEVYDRYGEFDVVLIEAGQYDDKWPYSHMNPKNTLKAAEDLSAKWVIPIHWGAFVLANHSWDDSVNKLTSSAEDSFVNVATPRIGETVDIKEIDNYQEKWWLE